MEFNAVTGELDGCFGAPLGGGDEGLDVEPLATLAFDSCGDEPSNLAFSCFEEAFSLAFGFKEVPKVDTNSGTTRSISFFETFLVAMCVRCAGLCRDDKCLAELYANAG